MLFTGTVQTFTAPVSGWYQIECYGGCAGVYRPETGFGGYSKGTFHINAKQTVYVMVGGSTNKSSPNGSILDYHDGWKAGWNGGGWGQQGQFEYVFSGGGGATDVRLSSAGAGSTNWQTGIYTRIIVAGGAGGSDDVNHNNLSDRPGGGNGGGLYAGNGTGWYSTIGRGATYASGFSVGQGQTATGTCGGGGGGGYYGGYASSIAAGAGGGSGFISGYSPCSVVSGYVARNPSSITGGNNRGTKVANVYFYLIERD